jgi:hypothetical protein
MIHLDKAHFANRLRKLAELEGKTLSKMHRDEMRLNIEQCLRATAPMTFGREFSEALGKQRRLGMDAVSRDIQRVFVDEPEDPLAKAAQRILKANGEQAANDFLTKSKTSNWRAAKTANSVDHRKARSRNGRVRKNQRPFVLVNEGQIKAYLKKKRELVGYTKAGWGKALQKLGAGIRAYPAWVRKKSAPGAYFARGVGTRQETLTAVNLVKWVADSLLHANIAKRVAKSRARNIEKRIVREQKRIAKGWRATSRT